MTVRWGTRKIRKWNLPSVNFNGNFQILSENRGYANLDKFMVFKFLSLLAKFVLEGGKGEANLLS